MAARLINKANLIQYMDLYMTGQSIGQTHRFHNVEILLFQQYEGGLKTKANGHLPISIVDQLCPWKSYGLLFFQVCANTIKYATNSFCCCHCSKVLHTNGVAYTTMPLETCLTEFWMYYFSLCNNVLIIHKGVIILGNLKNGLHIESASKQELINWDWTAT